MWIWRVSINRRPWMTAESRASPMNEHQQELIMVGSRVDPGDNGIISMLAVYFHIFNAIFLAVKDKTDTAPATKSPFVIFASLLTPRSMPAYVSSGSSIFIRLGGVKICCARKKTRRVNHTTGVIRLHLWVRHAVRCVHVLCYLKKLRLSSTSPKLL